MDICLLYNNDLTHILHCFHFSKVGKLGADCKALEDAGCDRIQFDVMDGNFVPNVT